MNLFQKIVSISLILSPILNIYGWGKYNFSFIIILFLSVINIFMISRNQKKIPKTLYIFFVFWLLSHFISSYNIHFGLIRIFLSIILFYNCIKLPFFIKAYRNIAFICIIFFFIQEIGYYFSGIRIVGILQFMPIALNIDNISYYLMNMAEYERSSSFFSEPAHFAQFLLPILTIELFAFNTIKWKYVGIILITLLLTQSGNALFGLVVILASYFFRISHNKRINFSQRFIMTITSVAIVAILGYSFTNSDIGKKLLSRADTIQNTTDFTYASSGFIRIWRGYYVFEEFDPVYKFIGNDNPDYISTKINSSIVSVFFNEEHDRYLNGVQQFLISTGYIGVLIFIIFIVKSWKKTNYCGKTLLMTMIAILFIASIYFTDSMLVPMTLSFLMPSNTILKEYNNKIFQQYEA